MYGKVYTHRELSNPTQIVSLCPLWSHTRILVKRSSNTLEINPILSYVKVEFTKKLKIGLT